MNLARMQNLAWLTAAAAILGLGLTAAARAAEGDDAKQQVQKLNSITGKEAIDAKVKELLKDATASEKLLKTADEVLKENPKAFQYNGASILARAALGLKKYEVGLRYYRICSDLAAKVQSSNKLLEAFEGQFFCLQALKKFEDAEKLCQKFLDTEGDDDFENVKPFILEQMIQTMARQGKIKEALSETERLVERDKGGWYFVRLKGKVLHEAGKLDEAVAAFQDTLKKLETAERLKPEQRDDFVSEIRYRLSGLFVELHQIDKGAEQLQILLKKKPDSPTYNNDLGFIWADNDMKLDESEKLIRKALDEDRKQRKALPDLPKDADKDNAAYLDSLGWVLFKKKQFPEAKKWLVEATKDTDEGQHVEILDHLADVHMAMGEKGEAIAVWKKALDQDISSKRDMKRQEEIRKKLKAAEGK